MSFKISCSKCGQKMEIEDDWIGKEAKCPNCQNSFIISKENELKEQDNPAEQIELKPIEQDNPAEQIELKPIDQDNPAEQIALKPIEQTREDNFVLTSCESFLKILKGWFIIHLIILLFLFITEIIILLSERGDNNTQAISIFFILLFAILNLVALYYIVRFIICYLKGVYQNLMTTRISTQSIKSILNNQEDK